MLKRFEWNSETGPKKLWANLREHGLAWFRQPEAISQTEQDRHLFVESILKAKTVEVQLLPVRVVKNSTSYQTSNEDAHFHTDVVPEKQPDLQVMVCKSMAVKGGESQFIDTWKVLNKIEKKDPALYKLLLVKQRPILTRAGPYWTPTFSWRNGNFVCTHTNNINEFDQVGAEFLDWLHREKPISFLMTPGDVYVANNLRMLHGRKAFVGNKRLYYRMLTTLEKPLNHPVGHSGYAKKIASLFEKIDMVVPCLSQKRS